MVGGVDTLFKDSSQKVQQYAANAYQTAGLSANAYMETVTSFSASLLQSLDGDTSAAADKANMAITDMSDNANKMGTDMASIQNAYQGFAKQNYTMLDNLKLGYGGTKEEMQRLLEDSEKISGIKYDISSYADVVDAIHVMQESMDIAGTTAKEASTTIEGSVNSAKAAWSNLLVGIADDNQDFDLLVNQFVDSVATAADNIIPRVETSLKGVGKLVEKLIPVIVSEIPSLLDEVLPSLVTSGISIVQSLVDGIGQNMDVITESAIAIGTQIAEALIEIAPDLIVIGFDLITQLIVGIAEALPELIPKMGEAIETIVQAIQENLPLILQAGLDILLQLASGIGEALPELIPTIVDIILSIVDVLTAPENLSTLVDAAIAIILGLTEGLIAAIPKLIERVPEIVVNLVTALIENAPKLVDASNEMITQLAEALITYLPNLLKVPQEIVKGLVDKLISKVGEFSKPAEKWISQIKTSIETKWEDVKNGVEGWISSLVTKFTDTLGAITGFADIGQNIVTGIWDGITAGWTWLTDQVSALVDSLFNNAKNKVNGKGSVKGESLNDEGYAYSDGVYTESDLSRGVYASYGYMGAATVGGTYGSGYTQIVNVNQQIATADELARAVRVESRYGLMVGRGR